MEVIIGNNKMSWPESLTADAKLGRKLLLEAPSFIS